MPMGAYARQAVEGECYYCGAPSDTTDHVVPRTHREKLEATMTPSEWVAFYNRMPDTVPCCHDCNGRKSNLVFDTVPNICAYLHNALESKHRRRLTAPLWSETELDQLGPGLRADVEHQTQYTAEIRRRLEVLRRRATRQA
jgi:hypothetical protein